MLPTASRLEDRAVTQPIPTKAQLIEGLRSSRQFLLDTLRPLAPEVFEQGRYESGWNGRQILANVASIEWTYPRLLEIPKQPPAPAAPSGEPPTRTAQGGIDAYNARQVDQRANATVAELLAEFEKNRAATIAAVEGCDEALLAAPIRSAGGVSGPLASVINSVAVQHVIGHTRDIVGSNE